MKRHAAIILSFALVALCVASELAVAGQKRRVGRVTSQATRSAVDYSAFSHLTRKHQGACNSCHKVPTENWKKIREFPDVADYPGHDACVSCHRPQFFRAARPAICSVCHLKVSPRDDVRFAFGKPGAPRQFVIEFPHDKHQDVIAQLARPVKQTVSLRAWSHARLVLPQTQTNSLRYNHCEICHGPRMLAPVAPPGGWTDAFVPDAATFRAAPSSHAACFNCHWRAQQPTSDNCAGCHKLSEQAYVKSDSPKRLSLKFRHAREQHTIECTSCHINITKAATLRGLLPDVPITSCSECHNKDGLRLDVSKELEAIDKNREFVCSYCHTSNVGRLDPPESHYRVASRDPLKRKDIK
jgi:hypothetical protein